MRARELINALVQTNTEQWLQFGLLSYQWWILLLFLTVPWIIWVKTVDKKRVLEIILLGTLVIIPTTLLDLVGYNLHFWDYPIEILPLVPGALPFDLSMVPVAYMLLYQYLRTWKSYMTGLLGMAVLYAFIGEPFSNWIALVIYLKWRYIYSFVFYILTGVTVRVTVEKLKDMQTMAWK
jgi:hypothetical protein